MPVGACECAVLMIKVLFASIASREVRVRSLLYVATRDDVRRLAQRWRFSRRKMSEGGFRVYNVSRKP